MAEEDNHPAANEGGTGQSTEECSSGGACRRSFLDAAKKI